MEVEVISTDCIKPSYPTPQHLRTHKISLLDQFLPPIHIPMLLFYTAGATATASASATSDTTQQKLERLKQSLSEALTHFYPLAGRIKDKLSIECNDEGVHFTEAKSSCTLFEFVNQTDGNFSSHIHKLLPTQPSWEAAAEGPVAMIQVTCFPCGGIVIGTLVSHMIADGAAVSFFLNSWGAISRRAFHSSASLFPDFDTASSKFPRNTKDAYADAANLMAIFGPFLNKGRIGMRRLLFGAEAIYKLKAQGSSLTGVRNPTRVEAVSSLICKCIAKVVNSDHTLVTHAVNMRTRASPAFSDSCMCNFVWLAMMDLMRGDELPELVTKMREAITTINSEFVKGLEGEGGYLRYDEVLKQMVETASLASASSSKVNFVHCASWCNFGLYGLDYGWGKPSWVSCTSSPPDVETVFVNSVLLMDTIASMGIGIEAWVYVREDHISILEQDKDLLAFATLDPNPLPPI